MKLFSIKNTLFLGCALLLAKTFADEVEIEEEEIVDDSLDIDPIDEELNEILEEERKSGIVDTTNYPGRIISRKRVVSEHPAAGQPLEIEYTIWNVGNTNVLDVEVVDDSYTTADFTKSDKVTIRQANISPGKSYSESVTVVPRESENGITLLGAKVSYKSVTSKDNEELIQYNSEGASEGQVKIATAAYYARKVASHKFDWLCFLLIAMPTTLIPYMNADNLVKRYTLKAKSA